LYNERNFVERLYNKLKNFRRIATRYDKTACGIHDRSVFRNLSQGII
jgi:transposase